MSSVLKHQGWETHQNHPKSLFFWLLVTSEMIFEVNSAITYVKLQWMMQVQVVSSNASNLPRLGSETADSVEHVFTF